ncbi:BsuBI/PstI family type II restriction endonuclease [Acinetobacter baumannii]|uniref:BsuBI/PstI family type II restriction endonuclease n=1 Tax=Acinetobacter calcoaceticus/baumannii complex TaxID=909768 RepID=UPI002AF7108E|nr:restriction endonuclease [Acinetobacter baumannii]
MKQHIKTAQQILQVLGFPPAQTNERSARVLLALLDLPPNKPWSEATNETKGVWPIIQWIAANLDKSYAMNSRETIRKDTLHQFVAAGLVIYNGEDAARAVNSPKAGYHIDPLALDLLRLYGTPVWDDQLEVYQKARPGLAIEYARRRELEMVPVITPTGEQLQLSPGAHSELIRDLIQEFAPRFVPGSRLVYAGDTGQKHAIFDIEYLASLGVIIDKHGKLPDVVLHYTANEKNWLVLAEACSSVGPVDEKRYAELTKLFAKATPDLVFVSGFPDRVTMRKFLTNIAWETEVWVSEAPEHMIHFNGSRFMGPYPVEDKHK